MLPVAVRLAILGAVSGCLSWGLLALFEAIGLNFALLRGGDLPIVTPLSIVPGLVFGAFFGAVLLRAWPLRGGRFLLYMLAAGIGYLAAFHTAYFSVIWFAEAGRQGIPGWLVWMFGGVLGGFAGSAILGVASKLLLRSPASRVFRMSVIAGTVAGGLLLLMSLDIEGHDFPKSLLAFFALWQGAYAASLAPLLQPDVGRR
jgi:hypothetical protein